MAGWKTTDMLSGIEEIMNLAAASGEDLATTSDIVTDALTAFGLSAADSTHFADTCWRRHPAKPVPNVSLMGETFKYVAPVAGALGYSAEDTAVAIGLMANAGIKGSQAGTVLRSMMTGKADKGSSGGNEQLGVSLTDNQGNMKSLQINHTGSPERVFRTDDDMTVELQFVKGIQGLEVQRTTKYSNYNFEDIEPRLFRLKGNVIKEANMLNKSDEYWASVRQVPLTKKTAGQYRGRCLSSTPNTRWPKNGRISLKKHWKYTVSSIHVLK